MSRQVGDEGSLDRALRELREAWSATADGWHDAAREDFDRQHLQLIEWQTRHAVRALSDLDALCTEAARKCE